MGLRYNIIISLFGMLACSTTLYAQNQKDTTPYQYIVKDGDSLLSIAISFGNPAYREKIYAANTNKIDTSHTIYIGQALTIPAEIVTIDDTSLIENSDRLKEEQQHELQAETENKERMEESKLEEFRKAFKRVVEQEKKSESSQKQASVASRSNQQSTISIDGMVLDETRSKMGTDFYNVFYRYWEPPSEAKNFMITISEQPTPTRGTMISISIDNEMVFQNRLQPRYAYTEKVAKQAVSICYRSLLRQQSSSNPMIGY